MVDLLCPDFPDRAAGAISGAPLREARPQFGWLFNYRTDEKVGRFATRLSVPQHFRGQRPAPVLRIACKTGRLNVKSYSSVTAGWLPDDRHSMGGDRPVRRRMEARHI